jgi:hypothetical protein
VQSGFARCLAAVALFVPLSAFGQTAAQNGGDFSTKLHPRTKVPENAILFKGTWSSVSDSATAVPEGGSLTDNLYRNEYFGITYPLPRRANEWRNTRRELLSVRMRRALLLVPDGQPSRGAGEAE